MEKEKMIKRKKKPPQCHYEKKNINYHIVEETHSFFILFFYSQRFIFPVTNFTEESPRGTQSCHVFCFSFNSFIVGANQVPLFLFRFDFFLTLIVGLIA